MEIKSPSELPGLVTIENIKKVRYARNPNISMVESTKIPSPRPDKRESKVMNTYSLFIYMF